MMEKNEVVFNNEKLTWYLSCLLTVGCLAVGLVSKEFGFFILLPFLFYECFIKYRHLKRRIILTEKGFTDENDSFYAWDSMDHCYFSKAYIGARLFVIVFKDKDTPSMQVGLGNYNIKKNEFEEIVNRLSGRNLMRYADEDMSVDKEKEKSGIKGALIGLFICLIISALIVLFSRLLSLLH